jgi:Xaa-Pro dipeptidase
MGLASPRTDVIALDDPLDGAARRRLSAERLDTLRTMVRARDARAALLRTRANVAWATAGAQHHVVTSAAEGVGALLVGEAGSWFLAPNIEAARLRDEEIGELGLDIVEHDWWAPEGLERDVTRLLGGAKGPVLSDADLDTELRARRSLLGPLDHERMARLGAIAVTEVEGALADARSGMTEHELAADLLSRLPGIRAPVVLVAADDRIARFRHPLPTARHIQGRVMLVLVAEAWGLHVALTRFRSWRPDSEDIRRRWAAVATVQGAMHAASRPGVSLGEVLAVAQQAYADAGYPDEWRDHHQGGIIAYEGRERVAVPDDPTTIIEGMALAWNPSIAGVKVEDTIVVGADGHWVVTARAKGRASPGGSSRG